MVDMLHMVRDVVVVRHVHVRGMSAIGAIVMLGQPRGQGSLPSPRGGSIMSSGGIGRDMDRDTVSVVSASESRHGGRCASQAEQGETKEICQLHCDGGCGTSQKSDHDHAQFFLERMQRRLKLNEGDLRV